MTPYRLVRHAHVAADLLDIAYLIAEYAGTETALRKIDEIERAVLKLTETPHIGSLRDEIAMGLRAIPVANKGVLCFVVDDEAREVRLIAIGYAGSNWIAKVAQRD